MTRKRLGYQEFKAYFYHRTNIDLDLYDEIDIYPRLIRELKHRKLPDFKAYLELITENQNAFFRCQNLLTTNRTAFFRQPRRWQCYIRPFLLPEIIEERGFIRGWSAGCSAGCELYSLAMLADQLAPEGQHRLLGTDISDYFLNVAQSGIYNNEHCQAIIKKQYRERYLVPWGTDNSRIIEPLRKKVEFRQGNLLIPPLEGGFDFVICQYVTCYFNRAGRQVARRNLVDSLRQGGYLYTDSFFREEDVRAHGLVKVSMQIFRKE